MLLLFHVSFAEALVRFDAYERAAFVY